MNVIINSNGFKPLFIVALLWGICLFFQWELLGILFFIAICVLLYIYREPNRSTLSVKNALTALTDGHIVGIERLPDKVCVRIENALFDVGVIKAPTKCKVIDIQPRNGLVLPRTNLNAKHFNDQYLIYLFHEWVTEIKIQTGSLSLIPPKIATKINASLDFAQNMGFLWQGEIWLYLDNSCRLKVNIGDKLQAGQTIIATFER